MQESYIKNALDEALSAQNRGEVPIGAVIVEHKTGKIIAADGNRVIENNDPTAHAEMNVIRQACKAKNSIYLEDCDIYISLEPCAMCGQAISHARLRRVYYGAYDPKSGGVDHGAKVFGSITCHHKPEVYGGIMETECAKILVDFFKDKRG